MKVYRLVSELELSARRPDVFAFFERPENLSLITPPQMGFKILTPTPLKMKEGAIIDYRVKILGVPQHWRTLISEYDPPNRFVDQQLKGPYLMWHHSHTFEEQGDNAIIRDEINYVLPFGPLGQIARALFVRRQLEGVFRYRRKVITELLTAGKLGR